MTTNYITDNIKTHTPGIYTLIVKTDSSTRYYVGQSLNIRVRLNKHMWMLEKNKHANSHLQNCFNKYGIRAFSCEVLYALLVDPRGMTTDERKSLSTYVLTPIENQFIEILGTTDTDFGFNQVRGQSSAIGGPGRRKPHSIETREKFRLGKLGNKNPMFGKNFSEEHRRKLSGRTGDKHPLFGKPVSEETRVKMKMAKPLISVYSINPVTWATVAYDCLRDAGKDGFSRNCIEKCRDTFKLHKGFLWRSGKSTPSIFEVGAYLKSYTEHEGVKPSEELHSVDVSTGEVVCYEKLSKADSSGTSITSIRKYIDTGTVCKGFTWVSGRPPGYGPNPKLIWQDKSKE